MTDLEIDILIALEMEKQYWANIQISAHGASELSTFEFFERRWMATAMLDRFHVATFFYVFTPRNITSTIQY
jgi:hypothetical protein